MLQIPQNISAEYIGAGQKWIERHGNRFVFFQNGQSIDVCQNAPIGMVWRTGEGSFEIHLDGWIGTTGSTTDLKSNWDMLIKFQREESKTVQVV